MTTTPHAADIAPQIVRRRNGDCTLSGATVGRITRNEREVWGGRAFSRMVVWDVYAADGRYIGESFSIGAAKLNLAYHLPHSV